MRKILSLIILIIFIGCDNNQNSKDRDYTDYLNAQEKAILNTKTLGKPIKLFLNFDVNISENNFNKIANLETKMNNLIFKNKTYYISKPSNYNKNTYDNFEIIPKFKNDSLKGITLRISRNYRKNMSNNYQLEFYNYFKKILDKKYGNPDDEFIYKNIDRKLECSYWIRNHLFISLENSVYHKDDDIITDSAYFDLDYFDLDYYQEETKNKIEQQIEQQNKEQKEKNKTDGVRLHKKNILEKSL